MATSNDIKNGTVIKEAGQLWSVVEFQHVKPGKGGAFVRTKQKNVVSGKIIDKTYNAGAKIETASVDRRDFQYLYQDGADFVFMDKAQHSAGRDLLDSVQLGDIPGIGMVMIDGLVRCGRSRNTPPATEVPVVL